MGIMILEIFARAGFSNYEGGTNPLLIYLFVLSTIGIGTAIIGYTAWEIFKKIKFVRICTKARITGEEQGILRSFFRRTQYPNPLIALLRKSAYDKFVNEVGYLISTSEATDDDLEYDIHIFNSIRTKLGLKHSYRFKKLHSSRSLPKFHPIVVTFYDPVTKNSFHFDSKVLENNDLFLGISVPPLEIDNILMKQNKAPLEISFIRENDAEFHFDTRLYKKILSPELKLYLQHSALLARGNPQVPLEIPATLISHAANNVEEQAATIELLNNKNCTFILDDENSTCEKESSIILNFKLNGKNLSLQGTITQIHTKKGQTFYRLSYPSIDEKTKSNLISFMVKQRSSKTNK